MEQALKKLKHSNDCDNNPEVHEEWDYSSNVDEDYLISDACSQSKIKSLTCKPKFAMLLNSGSIKGRKLSHDTNQILPSVINSKFTNSTFSKYLSGRVLIH